MSAAATEQRSNEPFVGMEMETEPQSAENGVVEPPTSSSTKESSISVSVRVRPFTDQEEKNLVKPDNESIFLGDGSLNDTSPKPKHSYTPFGIRKIIDVVDDKMLIFDPPDTNPIAKMHRKAFPSRPNSRIREHRFVFDKLFDVGTTQKEVFESTTKSLLDSIMDGFNSTVFAYGATGCGKTHTISGTPEDPGLIFLTMEELYRRIEDLKDTKVFEISLSFLEIYNETIKDLLNPETEHKKLMIREDMNQKVFVSNLSAHQPQSVEEVMDLILLGNRNRTCSPTEANATSSRSHAVLQINVNQRDKSMELSQEHTFATLSIIDLAGSERASATKNRGARLTEGANINRSLLALGNCINALCDPRRRNHIPYRDSKLTRLLKFSLGGNCKTVMIVCISPSSQHYDETLNTLKYANRAKEIKTKLIRNQHNLDRHVGSYLKMITQQKQELEELKTKQAEVIGTAIRKREAVAAQNIEAILESMESLKNSIFNKNQDRWQKYFILAKRKVLLNQKIEFECIQSINLQNPLIQTLIEQILSKLNLQIQQLELQYGKPTEIDYILGESSQHVLKRLKEQDGWTDHLTRMFENCLASLRDLYEKDVLFNSSILYDQLVVDMQSYGFGANSFKTMYSNFVEAENSEDIIGQIIRSLEFFVHGDFDALLESKSSAFMQNKVKELEALNYNKRASSPLRVSPPLKKPAQGRKISPMKGRMGKKVHFMDTSMLESDMSFDESTMLKSDFEDGSPSHNSILDGLNDDDLLKFNPTISSPPLNKTSSISVKKKPKRVSSLTHKKLDDKLPLLNKEASKLVNDRTWRSTSSPSHLIQFGMNEGTRNIESNGSERVE